MSSVPSHTGYDRGDYGYRRTERMMRDVVDRDGLVSKYLGLPFESLDGDFVHINHIVALKEAHDSGACAWADSVKKEFAKDVLNLVLAEAKVNMQALQEEEKIRTDELTETLARFNKMETMYEPTNKRAAHSDFPVPLLPNPLQKKFKYPSIPRAIAP